MRREQHQVYRSPLSMLRRGGGDSLQHVDQGRAVGVAVLKRWTKNMTIGRKQMKTYNPKRFQRKKQDQNPSLILGKDLSFLSLSC